MSYDLPQLGHMRASSVSQPLAVFFPVSPVQNGLGRSNLNNWLLDSYRIYPLDIWIYNGPDMQTNPGRSP